MTVHPSGPHADDELDAVLLRVLGSHADTAGPSCLTPEQIAAFVDGGANTRERELWLRHLAGCRRCTDALGAVVRASRPSSMPLAAGTSRNGVARRMVRWVVPAGVAAAAAMAWLVIRQADEDLARTPRVEQATSIPAAAAPAPMPDAAQTSVSSAPPVSVEADESQSVRRLARTAERAIEPAAAGSAAPKEAVAKTEPARATASEADRERLRLLSAEPAVPTPSAPGSTPSPVPAAEAPAAVSYRGTAIPTPRPPGNFELASGTVRWRLRGSGLSMSDDGRSWRTLGLPPDVVLTTGVSTRAETCWLVGHGGVVLRVVRDVVVSAKVPTTEEIVAIGAPSDQVASVLTASGVAFTTADGGATWRQRR